jgi:hypothetical protein
MNNLFNQSKPASEYPKNWYVIPTMEVIELIEKIKSEVKNQSSHRVINGQAPKHDIELFTHAEEIGREMERELVLQILDDISQQSILETPNKKQNVDIQTLKSEWRKKVQRMKFMSGEVAVFELESLLDKINSQQNTNTTSTNSTWKLCEGELEHHLISDDPSNDKQRVEVETGSADTQTLDLDDCTHVAPKGEFKASWDDVDTYEEKQ